MQTMSDNIIYKNSYLVLQFYKCFLMERQCGILFVFLIFISSKPNRKKKLNQVSKESA